MSLRGFHYSCHFCRLLGAHFPDKMAVIAKETSATAAISRGSENAIIPPFDKVQSVEVQLGLVSKCGGTCVEWCFDEKAFHNIKDKTTSKQFT